MPNTTGIITPTENMTVLPGSLLHVNMINVYKLTTSNYIRQVHAFLDGFDLAAYLDASDPDPEQFITIDGSTTPNRAYSLQKRYDKLIFSAILGVISLSIQPILSKANTTAEIWETLASTYAKSSRSHTKQLKYQLEQWKKGAKTVDEYLQGLTTRFDQLALLGKVIDLEDQIEYVLEGLREDYKSVIDQVEGKDAPPALTELHEKLINHEAKIIIAEAPSHIPISAHVTTNKFKGQYKNNRIQPWQHNQRTHQEGNTSNWQPRLYLGKCQICGVHGHSARRCSQLMRHSVGVLPTPAPWQLRANFVFVGSSISQPWLLDSGATHHISSDLSNLSLHQPYIRVEEVLVGDGNGLQITHTSSVTLPLSQRSLSLTNVLHVPEIKKNIISVYKLCNANKISVELYPSHFQVSNLSSGVQLLQGCTKDELNEWPMSCPTAYTTSTNNLKTTFAD